MKSITVICLFIILCNPALSQNGFEWQYPLPTGHHYYDVQLLENNIAVAVGLDGTFIRSDNGGNTWSYHYVPTESILKAVFFVNNDTGFVTGINNCYYPKLFKTMDGGTTWDSVTTPIPATESFNDIYFISADTGWVTGYNGIIYCTHDGGLTWIDQSVTTNNDFNVILMLDSDTGFVAGENGEMRKTTDGGTIWNIVPTGTTNAIYSLFFTSHTTGFFAGYSEIIKRTIDGGLTWTQQSIYVGSGSDITSLFFTDSLNGFGISQYRLYRSTNGGVTWNFVYSPTNILNSAAAIDTAGNGIMVGYSGNIQKTNNKGATWTTVAANTNVFDLNSITFTDKTHGWAIGAGFTLLRTTNGISWTRQFGSLNGSAYDVCFLNNNLGYIVGQYGIVYKTTDGGITFTNVNTPGSTTMHCVHFVNASTGWVAGDNSTLYKTTNGGTTWTAQTLPNFAYFLWDIYFVNADTGYVCGSNHRLFKTVNGGTTWTLLNLPPVVDNPYHLQFFNADTGWVSTSNALMLQTTDGGLTWQNINFVGVSPAYGFHFFDAMHGFVGGGFSFNCDTKLFTTNDGGVTWQNTHLPFWFDINAVYMTDTNSVYIAGDYGNIIHYGDSINTITTGVLEINESSSFNIYPNPAGSQFTITSSGVISFLQITDLSGRVLLSRNFHSMEIISTTQFLNDGVYMITINSDQGRQQTKKLVIRKNQE